MAQIECNEVVVRSVQMVDLLRVPDPCGRDPTVDLALRNGHLGDVGIGSSGANEKQDTLFVGSSWGAALTRQGSGADPCT